MKTLLLRQTLVALFSLSVLSVAVMLSGCGQTDDTSMRDSMKSGSGMQDSMMKDGMMKDGAMKDGMKSDGMMKDGMMKDGAMKDGAMKDGAMKDGPTTPAADMKSDKKM